MVRMGVTLTFPGSAEQKHAEFSWNMVSPGYFQAMQIPILQGRSCQDADAPGEPVAIVNETVARR